MWQSSRPDGGPWAAVSTSHRNNGCSRAAAEAEVLELLWEFYGWAPDHVPGERVTVYLELGPEHDAQEIRAGDRVLLSRNSPYSQPRIPSNVDLVEGQLPRRASLECLAGGIMAQS